MITAEITMFLLLLCNHSLVPPVIVQRRKKHCHTIQLIQTHQILHKKKTDLFIFNKRIHTAHLTFIVSMKDTVQRQSSQYLIDVSMYESCSRRYTVYDSKALNYLEGAE